MTGSEGGRWMRTARAGGAMGSDTESPSGWRAGAMKTSGINDSDKFCFLAYKFTKYRARNN